VRPSERQVKVTLRLPETLHRRIVELAVDERRSLNNFMIRLLEDYVRSRGREGRQST